MVLIIYFYKSRLLLYYQFYTILRNTLFLLKIFYTFLNYIKNSFKINIYIIIILYMHCTFSATYILPKNNQNRLIGENIKYIIPSNNKHSLEYFARKFQVGLRNILEANPTVDLYLPSSEKLLIIPKQLILPNTAHIGIIINSVETRLFYYPKNSNIVIVFPIAIGTSDHETPPYWLTKIKYKKKDPIWIPTQDMRNEYIKRGEILPTIFPAGPNNPMGSYALYVGNSFAIHGTTNKNSDGIGLRITRGCIRLRSQDIKHLYTVVPIGTRVEFINEPVKIATSKNGLHYIEIHCPLFQHKKNQYHYDLMQIKLKKYVYKIIKDIPNINYKIVDKAIKDCSGIPINITNE